MTPSVTPRSLVLDLLRVAEPRAIPVRALTAIGAFFGISDNAVRVAVARLVAKGLLESDERGSYRLAPATSPLGRYVERWRQGEARRVAWNGEWLCVWLPRGADRAVRRSSLRALELVGFREGLDALWVRPDNLAAGQSARRAATANETGARCVFSDLEALGLEEAARWFTGRDFGKDCTETWQKSLWALGRLAESYLENRQRLERSAHKVETLLIEQALVETFVVGGAAIRVLATDPLLPDEILESKERAALSEKMLVYDTIGRRIWRGLLHAGIEGRPYTRALEVPSA